MFNEEQQIAQETLMLRLTLTVEKIANALFNEERIAQETALTLRMTWTVDEIAKALPAADMVPERFKAAILKQLEREHARKVRVDQ